MLLEAMLQIWSSLLVQEAVWMGSYMLRVLRFSTYGIVTKQDDCTSPWVNPGPWPLLLYSDLLFDDIENFSIQQLFIECIARA